MQKLTRRREDAKKMNKKVISDQFWDEPEAGRNGVGNGRPEQDLCVFASRRESLFFVSKNGVRCKPVTDRRSGRRRTATTERRCVAGLNRAWVQPRSEASRSTRRRNRPTGSIVPLGREANDGGSDPALKRPDYCQAPLRGGDLW